MGAGTTYFINRKLAVEGVLYYEKTKNQSVEQIGLSVEQLSINFRLDFEVYFGLKKRSK
ncbi:MAG: hypothetical protein ACJA2S_001644 [Cyclobacteriaceae bacterium]|jgi:hypothetical protein